MTFDTTMGILQAVMNTGESVKSKIDDDTLKTFSNLASVTIYMSLSFFIVWFFVSSCDDVKPLIGNFDT
jgi:hypothetical protein